LLLEQIFGPLTAQQSSTLLRLQHSAKDLLSMIDNVLQVGRLEANKLPVKLQEIGVPAFITQLQTEISELCEQSELQFEWQIEEELPILFTDVSKLKVVLKNLIGNAIKFTPERTVTITARAQRNGVEVGVSDTGPGIPREDLRTIFGLYIVRQMLDLLGGSVSVESTVGKGSTFWVWIPQRRVATQSSLSMITSQLHYQIELVFPYK
jgi:signal transduction histidine kinase